MTYVKELPQCQIRYGRTEIIENGKKRVKLIVACGYREVDPEECICCGGYKGVTFELKIHPFIRMIKHRYNNINR